MRATVLGSAVALALCGAAPFAQQPVSTPTPAHNVFVATGCLSAGSDRVVPAFKLTDASAVGRTAPAAAGEPGAVGTSGVKSSTYELQPASGVTAQGKNAAELKALVGQRVEVVLRPVQTTAAPAPTTASLGVQTKPLDAPPERFTVTEIKSVTGTCS